MIFTLESDSKSRKIEVNHQNLFAIGYAGRNIEKTLEHIRELERDLGVPAPQKIPTIFQCSNLLLTQEPEFHVIGERTCGECEYVIVMNAKKIYIGVGSDHTDRELESASVPKAKQVCPKPVGNVLWDYDEIKGHFDEIAIRSWQRLGDEKILYQDGYLADILPVETILEELRTRVGDIGDAVVFSGTVPALEGFKFGSEFSAKLIDERLSRALTCDYKVIVVSEGER